MCIGGAWLIGLAAAILLNCLRFSHEFGTDLRLICSIFCCLLPFTDWVCNFMQELLKVLLNFWLIWIYLFFRCTFLNRLLFRIIAHSSCSQTSTRLSQTSWPASPRSGGFGSAWRVINVSAVVGLASSLRRRKARLVFTYIFRP